jgi:hypothetical protein
LRLTIVLAVVVMVEFSSILVVAFVSRDPRLIVSLLSSEPKFLVSLVCVGRDWSTVAEARSVLDMMKKVLVRIKSGM